MKTQVVFSILFTTLLTSIWGSLLTEAKARSNNSPQNFQFICDQSYDRTSKQYIFTTFAWKPERKKKIITWRKEDFSSKGFDPQERCKKVSPRLQNAYANQNLKFLMYGIINGQPVICASRQPGGNCDTLLLTLQHQDDALKVLEKFRDTLSGSSDGPLEQSSEDDIYKDKGRIYVKVDVGNVFN